MRTPLLFLALAMAGASQPVRAAADTPAFDFESVSSLDQMTALIRERYALRAPRSALRAAFVDQGHATLKVRPAEPGVEKYIYDINQCGYYVWRWNISADYDAEGGLRQAYVNGNPVLADGTPKRASPRQSIVQGKSTMVRVARARPEAGKGESSLAAIVLDLDGNLATTTDQYLMGAGPSIADPVNMGKMVTYVEVDPWRSIFDADAADRIVDFKGDCAAADVQMEKMKAAAKAAAANKPAGG